MPRQPRRSDTPSSCGHVRPRAEAKSPSGLTFGTAEEHLDGIRAQLRLREKAGGRTRRNQLGELLLCVRRDENYGVGEHAVVSPTQAACDGQAVVGPEVDVDERERRTQLTRQP